jgi:hypothetical protein
MKTIDADDPTRLAPPGAGLPQPELFVARLLFRWTNWRGTRERSTRVFENERDRVLALAQKCDDAMAARRVLIRRIPGMEDSSRYWSVWMTLDHLCIVHNAISRTLDGLGQGIVPEGEASTAAVKPSPDVDKTVVEQFNRSCARLLKSASRLPELDMTPRYKHPWFGPLNAREWYAMAGFHLNLHRHQIERILAAKAIGSYSPR